MASIKEKVQLHTGVDSVMVPKDDGVSDWFLQCLTFLQEFSWVFDYQVTKIFVVSAWEKIPQEWKKFLLNMTREELCHLPFGKIQADWPETFKAFIKTAVNLSVAKGGNTVTPVEIACDLKLGMNPKKQHEVSLLAPFLHQLMLEAGIDTVVDVGAGLGYLGQVLQREYRYRVCSLESDVTKTHGARQRISRETLDSSRAVSLTFDLLEDEEVMSNFSDVIWRQVQHFHQDRYESGSLRENVVGSRPDGVKICMTGLHCCGDLTPVMLKYFTRIDFISLLVCVSCCYHRMSFKSDGVKNFPMSSKCCDAMKKVKLKHCDWMLNVPAFRLAAQETRARWKAQSNSDHDNHERHVVYRGVLELFCLQENITLTKTSRKVARKSNFKTFSDFVEDIFERHDLISENSPECTEDELKEKLHQTYLRSKEFSSYVEPLTALQVLLQSLLEKLIHEDRRQYLEEQGFMAEILPLFDESVSPRHQVLIGKKKTENLGEMSQHHGHDRLP